MSTIFLGTIANPAEVLRASAKQQLDSYADEWIVIFEALQNALDATELITDGKVRIEFDVVSNTVTVFDNGPGFPSAREFFGLGKGSKNNLNDPNVRGEHGIGIKMVILCSKKFELLTRKIDRKLWYARFNDGYKFLSGAEKEFFDEDYQNLGDLPEGYNTKVKYSFPSPSDDPLRPMTVRGFVRNIFEDYKTIKPFDEYTKKKDLTALYLEHYFRTHSYSGDVNRLFDDKKPTLIEIVIKKDQEISPNFLKQHYPEYLISFWEKFDTVQFPAKYWDITEIFPDPGKKGFLTENHLKSFRAGTSLGDSRIWALKITDKQELKNLLINPLMRDYYDPAEFDDFISNRLHGLYIIIASASTKGRYNINRLILGKTDQIIAADGVITTNQIRTPKRGKNQNYLNNIHLVVNIRDRVNYGKQGVKNPKLLSLLYKYFEEIYVKNLVDLAISVAGKQPKPTPFEEPDISYIEMKNIVRPTELSIKKEIIKENTLIAVFYELIGRGVITGIQTYQLSSIDPYDGKINMIKPKTNDFKTIKRNDDLLNLEFKVKLQDLIDECETGVKDMSEMHLIVVWDDSLPPGTSKYHFIELEQSSFEGLSIPGIEEVLSDMEGNQVPVLKISKFVENEK